MSLVVDASIIVRLLANRHADDLLRQRLSPPRSVHAPHLIDVEVASAVRGLLLSGRLRPARATEMIADFSALRISRHPMGPLLPRVLELRHNVTANDACYLALAEALALPLLTLDAKLAGASGHAAAVQVHPRLDPL